MSAIQQQQQQLNTGSAVLKRGIEQQRLQIAPECQIWRQRSDGCR